MSQHLDRKELKRPDTFLEQANTIVEYINENSKTFVLLLAGLFALGLGYAGYSQWNSHREEQANSAVFTARKHLVEAFGKLDPKAADWEDKVKKEIEEVQTAAKTYAGSRASFDALLTLGDIYLEKQNYSKAVSEFEKAKQGASKNAKPLAQHSLAYAYEGTNNFDGAIKEMAEIQDQKSLRIDVLMSLGRLYRLKGDKPKAVAQYETILKEYPNTAASKTAASMKALLQ